MICTNCNKAFEKVNIENKLEEKLSIKTTQNLCHMCRMKERYQKVANYSFIKSECVECKKSVVSSNPQAKNRKIVCMDCYGPKLLDVLNAEPTK